MEILEQGVLPALVLIIYAMIDKVIVPLLKGRANGKPSDRNHEWERRIDRNENDIDRNRISIEALRSDIHDVHVQVGTISGKIGVANAVLERIEQRLE